MAARGADAAGAVVGPIRARRGSPGSARRGRGRRRRFTRRSPRRPHDLKRLLAFHSVENIGIILIGVGLAMILWRLDDAGGALRTAALTAALLHTVNHAAFKGLLFLGAGSVLART